MYNLDKKTIGEKIKEIREEKDIKQLPLAKALNYSGVSSITKIENGSQTITIEQLAIIAKELGVDLKELIDVDEITKAIDSFMNLFKIITTSKEYPIEKDGVIDADNLLLKSDKECIVLTATKSVFDIVRKIAEIKIVASKYPNKSKGEEYETKELKKLKKEYKHFIKLKEESYFLISKDELSEIIEENVTRRIELYKLLNQKQN